ncbi:hypothetical protein ABIB60_002269 [Hymenobacter sp. UYP22]
MTQLLGDGELLGGNLCQSVIGDFLDVRIECSHYHTSRSHQRMNACVSMNKNLINMEALVVL